MTTALWCVIFQIGGKHATDNCHLLQKYTQTSQQLFYNFYRLVGHDVRTCRSYELMMDQNPTYRVQAKTRALDPNAGMVHVGLQRRGQGRGGMGLGRGRRQLICYNCRGPGHYARDCMNLRRTSCLYWNQFYHEEEEFPTLIVRLRKKGVLQPPPTQNFQMMRPEPRKEDPNVNIVLRSGITIGDDKGKQPEESAWVRKAPTKEPKFDLERAKATFIEAKKSFTKASTLGSKDQLEPRMDPSMLTTFLETCTKLVHDSKAIKGLQELITRCMGSGKPRVVRKLGKNALRTGTEMILNTQIGEYEMDQVILDLGSDTKQTWERMGRPALQWSPIQL